MRINRLHLQNFGQFHNKDVTLAPGINVIYGENEAGKTTMKDFIIDMFYGIDKSQKLGNRVDHYEQRKPINGTDFSGAMQVSEEGQTYLIERDFSNQADKTYVKNLDTGLEVSLKERGSILGTLLHTEKRTYMDTLCITQKDIALSNDIVEKLNRYIVNMASSKAGDVNATNAIEALKRKKKEFGVEELLQKEEELTNQLSLNRDFAAELSAIQNERSKTQEELTVVENEKIFVDPIPSVVEEKEEQFEEKEPVTKRDKEIKMLRKMGKKSLLDNVLVILFIGLFIASLFVATAYFVPVNISEVKIAIMGVGALFAFLTVVQVLAKRAHYYRLLEEIEIEKGFEEARAEEARVKEEKAAQKQTIDVEKQKELKNRLDEIEKEEAQIISERNEQETILAEINQIREKIEANRVDDQALDLAIRTIKDLSEEIYDSFGSVLNEQVSNIVRKITRDKYTEVKIDEQLRVLVKSGTSFISMDYLSTGTVEQIYLAIRFAIANILVKEDLPIVMDDVFVNYDYQRLYEILSCLGKEVNRQVIIFTLNPRIYDMLTGMGIQSNYIEL